MSVLPKEKLNALIARHKTVQDELSAGPAQDVFVKLSREYASLDPIVVSIQEFLNIEEQFLEVKEIMDDPDQDPEMLEMAEEEFPALKEQFETLEQKIRLDLLPKDEADERDAILEVRAGTGGDEAALFAGNLFRMYQRYAELQGWKIAIMSANEAAVGGYKEIIASISGVNVFSKLKFESGVHRVQRVPETETSGRIHTSAATVAVLPEAEEVDVKVENKDLRIDSYRASGPGGQSVNTTDSAIRITHLPTGLIVIQQDEKSQHKNREKAMKVMMSRLYDLERQKIDDERAADRKGQVGTGDRSARIRTYNFPQGRVTDHRIGLTLHKLDAILAGDGLQEMVEALMAEQQVRQLAAMEDVS